MLRSWSLSHLGIAGLGVANLGIASLALALANCLAGVAWAEDKPKEPAPPAAAGVMVVQAKPGHFTASVHVTGFVIQSEQAVVTLELDGYQIKRIDVHPGDRVKAGQQLAYLERVGPASPAQQGLPASISLTAPVGGCIEKSTATLGAVTNAKGEPLFQIAVGDEIDMEAEVPGLYLAQIARGRPVRIEGPAGEVAGQVKHISSEIDRTTQMGHVRVIIGDQSLHAGSFVRATIEAGESFGVSVPRSAVNYGTDGTTVQVVRGQIVETRRVRIGLVSDHDAEIREGVRSGELVVAHAGSSLRDGDHVTTTFANPAGQVGRR